MPTEQPLSGSRQVYSLSEITGSIERMFSKYYTAPYWIKAEISKLNFYPSSGHCYPDLVEKSDGKVRSQVRSIIWRDDLYRISRKFEEVTRQPLSEGTAILFQAYVKFTSEYGLSLHITDIEPLYTLGEMARARMATIERLRKEGKFDLNRQLELPLLLKRLAIVSAETSKGYSDLMVSLQNNPYGYHFITRLFTALLQGDAAVESIRKQLQQIAALKHDFDAVLIIRGGGDEVGLACYDHYDLAAEVAGFPLPVITGIGHSTNETVVEMVACINKITPTDVAHFVIAGFRSFDERIEQLTSGLTEGSRQLLEDHHREFSELMSTFRQTATDRILLGKEETSILARGVRDLVNMAVFNHRIAMSRYETALSAFPFRLLEIGSSKLNNSASFLNLHQKHLLKQQADRLGLLGNQVQLLDPENVLRRGFTITRIHGKAIGSDHLPEAGTEIETETSQELIYSKFTQRKPK
ncbi:MAG: exodeoxyribonuclease VII large subunit [Bacteroidales bacterium]|nr:exodeoxyribonuclease VII large subunit [Bacteroidales bacterium]